MAEAPPTSDLLWTEEGAPRSARFDDVYFSGDGLAESRAVFLGGCGLPEAWAGRRRFSVAELGFGTGLNVLALLALWRDRRPPEGRLQIFSVEAYPMRPQEAARALAGFPDLAVLAAPLLDHWPRIGRGWIRTGWPELGATLDLALGEAAEALQAWSGPADAWFLDGFAPSRNPQMWRPEVLELVRARSADGARLATFTVAGAVRRELEAQGFTVSREPGHGRKKQRLEARLPESAAIPEPAGLRVAIVGGGVAGASLARALTALGVEAKLFDPSPGSGASGAPAALASPRLDAGDGPAARLYAQAYGRAAQLYEAEAADAVLDRGAVLFAGDERQSERLAKLSRSPLLPEGAVNAITAREATARLGEAAAAVYEAPGALTVDPRRILSAWLPASDRRAVSACVRDGDAWRLDLADGVSEHFDAVCLCAGPAVTSFTGLSLEPVRGQLTWSAPLAAAPAASSGGGYCIRTGDGGALFGATHHRGRSDTGLSGEDEAENLRRLRDQRPALAEAVTAAGPLASRAALRAATPDRLPLAGALGDGVFVLAGLGGRGFTTAPLLGEHVAALMAGAPSPIGRDLADAVDPLRFQRRASRRKMRPAKP